MRVFISYRRRIGDIYAIDALMDALSKRYGSENVFKDTDSIQSGQDYREVIRAALSRCDVLLVVIDPDWLSAMDRKGERRLNDPNDWVRLEIEEALKRKIKIVPVLLSIAEMPAAEDLPESMRELVYRNATRLRAGRDFQRDLKDLYADLEFVFRARRRRQAKIAGWLVLIGAGLSVFSHIYLPKNWFPDTTVLRAGVVPIPSTPAILTPEAPAPTVAEIKELPGGPRVQKANIQWEKESFFRGSGFGDKKGLIWVRIQASYYTNLNPGSNDVMKSETLVPISEDSIASWSDAEILLRFTAADVERIRQRRENIVQDHKNEDAEGYLIDYIISTADGKRTTSPFKR